MNNIEELSKPVGFVGLEGFSLLADGCLGVISPNLAFGEAPVYSHEYVEALIAQLEAANEKLSKPVVLPPRRIASSFVDEEFSNKDLAAIYNAARIEFSVKITNAGFTVEDE